MDSRLRGNDVYVRQQTMILRRLSESIRRQDWFVVLLEVVIVVIGVFIGIEVANWNESRQERQREAHYLARLDQEMDVIRERLVGGMEAYQGSVDNIGMLLDVRRQHAQNAAVQLPEDEVLADAIGDLTTGRVPAGSPAAFQEMVASGALDILTSDELRESLFAFDEFATVAKDGWRTLRDEHREAANAVRALVDINPLGDDPQTPDLEGTLVGFDRERFLTEQAIHGHLNVLQRAQLNQYFLVQRQLQLAEEVEALIAHERGTNEANLVQKP